MRKEEKKGEEEGNKCENRATGIGIGKEWRKNKWTTMNLRRSGNGKVK